MKYILILLGLAYFISPFDIIPDFLGLLGRLDDVLAIVALYWFYNQRIKKRIQEFQQYTSRFAEQNRSKNSENFTNNKEAERPPFDAWKVFKLPTTASKAEINKKYRQLVQEYHPDKVAHLGEELQQLAHQKMLEIQKAYDVLKK